MTKIAFMFPGQGSFDPGMGREIAEAEPVHADREVSDVHGDAGPQAVVQDGDAGREKEMGREALQPVEERQHGVLRVREVGVRLLGAQPADRSHQRHPQLRGEDRGAGARPRLRPARCGVHDT